MTIRRDALIGWGFVLVQVVLLVLLVVLPGSDHWPTPAAVETASLVLLVLGLLIIVAASLRLGPALTPTPVPRKGAALRTDGPYRWVRHPIYSGVLLIVLGLVVGSGNVLTACVGAVTAGFFHVKSTWEEARLVARHPAYRAYAASVGRFVPGIGGRWRKPGTSGP